MSRVKNRDTDLERLVRSGLHRRGLRFRKNLKDLPGKPDVVFTKSKVTVFIDGDFWHGFQFSEWKSSQSEFWQTKIQKNIDRDRLNTERLEQLGWVVVRLWQHEVKKDLNGCLDRVEKVVANARIKLV